MKRMLLASLVAFSGSATAALAEVKVELAKTHMCCGKCEKSANQVLTDAGVTGTASKAKSNVEFTAADDASAQKVLDALAAAGFYGVVENKSLKLPDSSKIKDGKVTSVTIKGVHNCCGACNRAIKAAIKKVDGVESDDAAANSESITVKGNFEPKAVIKSLNDAGFHGAVSQ